MRYFLVISLSIVAINQAMSQGSFYGGLQFNSDFYVRDEKVVDPGLPPYDNLKSSSEGWLNLDYVNNRFGFDLGIRMDLFLHSSLFNPSYTTPYTAIGIGRWYVRKRFDKVRITGGHFYDQFGSGIVFRAYEERTLGIDNAVLGAHVEFDPVEQLKIKAFAGVQRNRFGIYRQPIIGLNAESYFKLGDKVTLAPGFSVVNRTLDQESIDEIVADLEQNYLPENRFVPKYNTYVYGGYNTLTIGDVSWYIEAAAKTSEAVALSVDSLADRPGNVVFTTLNYSRNRFGIAFQFKRTKDFIFRTSPDETFLEGMISYIAPINRQNSLRLPARYAPASQEIEELSYSGDVTFSPIDRKLTVNLNYSEIRTFDQTLRFRELFGEAELKFSRKWKGLVGLQYVEYDQQFYEQEKYADQRLVRAFAPFVEMTYKISRKQALTIELQNQVTQQDFGSWLFGLVEYSISPWFSIAVSDMYNYDPNRGRVSEKLHYYQFFTSFTYDTHVLTLSYVRQVAGVVCTGGVCRVEPAFSGLRLTLNSTF